MNLETFNHFEAVPARLKFYNPDLDTVRTLPYKEARNRENPDLGAFLCELQNYPEVMRMRREYEARLATDSALEEAFYASIPPKDVHSTILRVDLLRKFTPQQVMDFCFEFGKRLKGEPRPDLTMGREVSVGDGIIFSIEPTHPEKQNPIVAVRHISQAALRSVGMPSGTRDDDFKAHSTGEYARALLEASKPRVHELLTKPQIEVARFQPDAVYVAVNWPERDDDTNYGSYPYTVLAKISFETGEVELFEGINFSETENGLYVPQRAESIAA